MKLFVDIGIEVFNNLGRYGPIILFLISMYLLWKKGNLFFYYSVGFFANAILNLILKGCFQHPRPCEDINTFNLALGTGKRFIFKDGVPHDIFGMPSGHSESVLYSTLFIYLALRKKNILYLYLFLSFVTMCQRIAYNYHTHTQVIVGAIVGALFGYFVYFLSGEKIKGHITEKLDDFGPI
jgi:membrane-associated phospholipid phosphatase